MSRTGNVDQVRQLIRTEIDRHRHQAAQAADDLAHLAVRRHTSIAAGLQDALRIIEEHTVFHPDPEVPL